MHRTRQSASMGSLEGALDLPVGGRLPPRSPLTSASGQRTPPTCPASPLPGSKPWPAVALSPTGAAAHSRSTGTTPVRPRPRSLSCKALPPVDLTHSRVLSNIVSSVYESNLTAEQCFATYGRMHAAPPLVGMSHADGGGHAQPAAAASTSAAGIVHHATRAAHSGPAATRAGLDGFGSLIPSDINAVDFGLATCLATPLDPGPGPERERRLAQLPATTTAAARSATYKLTSANDILQETSRFGDWVRRQGRRRKLERMQGLLAELGGNAVLGRLIDDTMLTEDTERGLWQGRRQRRREEGEDDCEGVDGAAPHAPCGAAAPGEELGLEPGVSCGRGSDRRAVGKELFARCAMFRDDMELMS
ncbi:hypothetical protein PLESTB_001597200 [Pleodorina starrii]|uniref:Uncharacterized protein n=1 Tax=Pleodorina starrii TaxID=330485 RepID=A0A9W6F8F9_9CHLO|nr:hypothetical protein PLESTM_001048000 [Pleodorina starrii]GLC60312.1 hypothetical protein PLESTB_001597200 [Pleodorina starrii]GLC75377.1 hypothetical protein PLESTF_001630300 [Pleodorina starrii]